MLAVRRAELHVIRQGDSTEEQGFHTLPFPLFWGFERRDISEYGKVPRPPIDKLSASFCGERVVPRLRFLRKTNARVAKLADAPDLGSGGAILRGSSPLPGSSSRGWKMEKTAVGKPPLLGFKAGRNT